MKRILFLLPLVVVLALGVLFFRGLSLDEQVPSALIARPFPAFSQPLLPVAEGSQTDTLVTEAVLKGQVSLVNVWATWCPTCYAEHPFFMKLAEQGFPIYGLNYKDDRASAIKWLANLGNPYKQTFEDTTGRLGIELGVRGAPETFLVDASGVIRYKHEGEVNERVWQEVFVPLINELRGTK